MPARPNAYNHPRRVRDRSAIDHAALAATADREKAGEHEFPSGPLGQVAPPVSRPARTVVPGRRVYCLPLLAGERPADHAGLPDALHEAGAAATLDLQDNWIIRITTLSDYLDCPGREVEGVVALRL